MVKEDGEGGKRNGCEVAKEGERVTRRGNREEGRRVPVVVVVDEKVGVFSMWKSRVEKGVCLGKLWDESGLRQRWNCEVEHEEWTRYTSEAASDEKAGVLTTWRRPTRGKRSVNINVLCCGVYSEKSGSQKEWTIRWLGF